MCTFDKEFICIEEDSDFSAKFEQSLLQYIDKKAWLAVLHEYLYIRVISHGCHSAAN